MTKKHAGERGENTTVVALYKFADVKMLSVLICRLHISV